MDQSYDYEQMLSSNRRRVKVQIDRLTVLLKAVKPAPSNFLFTDLVGRLVWNATATTNAIDQLADKMNDYGVSSLLRKLFECKVLLDYMLTTENRNVVIARIMAYNFFNISNVRAGNATERLSRQQAISDVRKIVEGFNEDPAIITLFTSMIANKRSHWHWLGESFEKTLSRLNLSDAQSFKQYSEFAHVDIYEDRLEPTEEIQYQSPVMTSRSRMAGLLGLVFMTNQDIIERVLDNRSTIAFDQTAYERATT
jgi:hypothetical protein